jgi:hypothetical protein
MKYPSYKSSEDKVHRGNRGAAVLVLACYSWYIHCIAWHRTAYSRHRIRRHRAALRFRAASAVVSLPLSSNAPPSFVSFHLSSRSVCALLSED